VDECNPCWVDGARGGDTKGGTKVIWRRETGGSTAAAAATTGPAVHLCQRKPAATGATDGGERSAAAKDVAVQPVEASVAPLVILADPRLAAVCEPFGRVVPGTHHSRVMSAVCGLPGDSPAGAYTRPPFGSSKAHSVR
jgi:hypothetical protein